jgi:outer membrane immunogenic protein
MRDALLRKHAAKSSVQGDEMKKFLLATVAIAALGSSASAADLAARPYTKAPPMVAAAYNWSGFYVGAMGGYGWSDRVRINGIDVTGADLSGGFAGGTIGFNYQAPGSMFVFGVEADGAWADISHSETAAGLTGTARINSFGSVTGRLGVAVNSVLLYGKGGYAWANNEFSATNGLLTLSDSKFHNGWTVGGGAEWAFAGPWSAKAEYMFARYDSENYFAAIAAPGVGFGMDVHTIKVGINYRFGGFGGPVVANY